MSNILKKYGITKDDFKKKKSITERYGIKKEDFLPDNEDGLKDYGIDKNNFFGEGSKFLDRSSKNLQAGVADLGRNLANTPHKLADLIGQGNKVANLSDPNFDFGEFFGAPKEKEQTLTDKLTRMAPEIAGSFALPGANLGRAGQAIGGIPKAGKFLNEALSQAIPQSLYAGTQSDKPLEGVIQGGLGSVAGTALGRSIEKGINYFRPSQRISSPLTKKELAKAHQQTKGTNTDLGNVIQNPSVQRLYENRLSKYTPEVYEKQQKVAGQVIDQGDELMKKLLGKHNPDNVPDQIANDLMASFKENQKMKNDTYKALDHMAEKENLKLELPEFSNNAKKYMAAIEDTNFLKHEPDAKSIMSKLIHYENPVKETTKTGLLVDKNGRPLIQETTKEYPSLKEVNILKGKLSNYAKMYAASPDASQRGMARIFTDLAKSLKQDIKQSIHSTGNEDLIKMYQGTEANYAKNFSPFLDKEIYKFIGGNADPQKIIQKFVQTSNSSDLTGKLTKLTKLQSKESPLAYGYLSRAIDQEGNLNPAKLATAIDKLGKNQLKTLFPDKKILTEVLNYKALVRKNKDALNAMFNPKTGQRVGDLVSPTIQAAAGALIGGAGGALNGGREEGVTGALLGSLGAPLVAKKFSKEIAKKLTDEGYRRKMINALVANKKTSLPKTKDILSKAGANLHEKRKPMELELIKGR